MFQFQFVLLTIITLIECNNILPIFLFCLVFLYLSLKTIQYIRKAKFMYLARRTALHIAKESKELVISSMDLFKVTWQINLRAIAISEIAEPYSMYSMWLLNVYVCRRTLNVSVLYDTEIQLKVSPIICNRAPPLRDAHPTKILTGPAWIWITVRVGRTGCSCPAPISENTSIPMSSRQRGHCLD